MTPNAFIGKTEKPWSAEITKALGPSAEIWKQLVDWLAFSRSGSAFRQNTAGPFAWNSRSEPSCTFLPATNLSARGLYHR
jgi:hypothetical protein